MKYMLLVYLDEQSMTDAEREHCYVKSAQLTQELSASGHFMGSWSFAPGRHRHECAECAITSAWLRMVHLRKQGSSLVVTIWSKPATLMKQLALLNGFRPRALARSKFDQ